MKKFNVFAKFLLWNIAKIVPECYFVKHGLLSGKFLSRKSVRKVIAQPLTILFKVRRNKNGS